MNVQIANALSPRVIALLNEALGADYIVKKASGGTYDSHSMTFKIEIRERVEHESGVPLTKEAQDFLDYAKYCPTLATTDLGKKFELGSKGTHRVTGYRRRARKFPMLVQNVSTGEVVCYKQTYIEQLLEEQHGIAEKRESLRLNPKPRLTETTGLLAGGSK